LADAPAFFLNFNMPKKKKRSPDINETAFRIVQESYDARETSSSCEEGEAAGSRQA
jgi:hypothetical protein